MVYDKLESDLRAMTPSYAIADLIIAICTNSPIPHLTSGIRQLHSILSAIGFRNIWHGILPKQLSQAIFDEVQDSNKWT